MTQEALKLARQLLWRYRHEIPIGHQPYMICHQVDEAFESIDEALAQPEPVAKYSDIVSDGGLDPRNTTPPQRTWVGLTFAEICECESEYANVFARNIEAKLKELNT